MRPSPFTRTILAAAVAVATFGALPSAPASAVDEPQLVVDVEFDGSTANVADTPGGTMVPVLDCDDAAVTGAARPERVACNATAEYGSDALGAYWAWTTDPGSEVGGGLTLETTAPVEGDYTIGLRFRFDELGSYRKVIDYRNQAADAGFYILDGYTYFYKLEDEEYIEEDFIEEGQVIDLVAVRSTAGEFATFTVCVISATGSTFAYIGAENADTDGDSLPFEVTGAGSRMGIFYDDTAFRGEFADGGRIYAARLWDGALDVGEGPVVGGACDSPAILSAMGAPLGGSGEEPATTPGPSWVARGGVAPTVPTGVGEWQQVDGSSLPLTVSSPAAGQVRYEGDGIQVTFTGAPGSSATNGLIADENGLVECVICARLAAGEVIEAWMFSDPRLVAAWRVDELAELIAGLPCQRFMIPVGTPLDGRGPVPAGVHTLQLSLPTSQGMQAVNVGVTVGGPVPTTVPTGEGPSVPTALVALGLLAAAVTVGSVRRRTVRGLAG